MSATAALSPTGQAYDGHAAEPLLNKLKVGNILLADRAYDSDAIRKITEEKGACAKLVPITALLVKAQSH